MPIDFKVNVDIQTTGKAEVDALERQIENLKKASPIKLDIDITGDGANIAKYFANIQKQAQTAGKGIGTSLQQGIKSVKFNGNLDDFTKSQVDMMNRVKKNTQKISKDVESTLNNATSKEAERAATQIAKRYETQMNNAEKQISAMNKKFQDNQNRLSKLQSDTGTDKYKDTYKNTSGYQVIEENLKRIKTLQDQINSESTKTNPNTDKINADLKEMTSLLSKSENAFNNLTKPIGALDASIASNKTLSWLKENSKAAKELGSAFEELAQRQLKATTAGELENYNKEFTDLVNNAKSKGLTGKSWFDEGKRAFKQIAEFTGIYGVLQNIMQDIPREMIQAVRDVDASKIELIKVSDASTTQLSQYWDDAAESAKKYGAAISDVISSTADWSRLGYNLDDAKKLSDATTLLQKVGDNMTQESSSQGIISTLKGFNMQADEVNKIVDVANQIANTQPIDTSGIFEGLERSASSMSAANNTFEQTVSLISAANSVVQDPSSVGTALKTISMRVRGADTELQQAGLDTEGMAESVAKLREEIVALSGVDIMKDENTFKSTYDILDELSKKWSELTDIQQAKFCIACLNV